MPESIAPLCLLTCESGRGFAESVARQLGQPLVPTTESWFSCGEGKLVIDANIRGSDAYVFQSCVGGQDALSIYDRFVMLLHAVEAAKLSDAFWVTAVLPYYPGSRQDKRKGRTREGISAGLFARMLSAAGAHRVLTVEIHNDAIAGMFDASQTTLETVYLTKHMVEWMKQRGIGGEVVVAPDLGGLERARRYAECLSADLAALSKERDYSQPNIVLRSTLIGEVAHRDVLLVDDIIDTGGSVSAAVDELKQHGAADITVACAHPLMSGSAWESLGSLSERADREGWRFRVVGTTSIAHENTPGWYEVYPIEPLISQVISKINSRGSVTEL
jgi:ribose-phosphate pyrophosphokinase